MKDTQIALLVALVHEAEYRIEKERYGTPAAERPQDRPLYEVLAEVLRDTGLRVWFQDNQLTMAGPGREPERGGAA